jgi:Tat protein translocase TatB subunit
MFDVGMQELLVVFVVALIFVGPKKLPEIARNLGKMMGDLKRAGEEIKGKIDLETMMEDHPEDEEDEAADRTAETATTRNPHPSTREAAQAEASPPQPTQGSSAPHDEDQGKDPEKTQG